MRAVPTMKTEEIETCPAGRFSTGTGYASAKTAASRRTRTPSRHVAPAPEAAKVHAAAAVAPTPASVTGASSGRSRRVSREMRAFGSGSPAPETGTGRTVMRVLPAAVAIGLPVQHRRASGVEVESRDHLRNDRGGHHPKGG